MLSDEMKHLSSRERIMQCGQKWKLLTNQEKNGYQAEFLTMRENYRVSMKGFLKVGLFAALVLQFSILFPRRNLFTLHTPLPASFIMKYKFGILKTKGWCQWKKLMAKQARITRVGLDQLFACILECKCIRWNCKLSFNVFGQINLSVNANYDDTIAILYHAIDQGWPPCWPQSDRSSPVIPYLF